MHEGHRQRMIERLMGEEHLQDHEILEIILYSAIPRKDTNETAHNLLDAFGNMQNVFHAGVEKLTAVSGVGVNTAAFLVSLGRAMDRIIEYRENDLPYAYSYDSFSGYVRGRFQFAKQEFIELYAVKKNGQVVFCQRFTSDEKDSVRISRTEIAKFVATFAPYQAILVHNHCSEKFYPSQEDDDFTKHVCLCLTVFGVELLDHYIVSSMGIYSYHMQGKMLQIRRKCESIVKAAVL